MKKFYFSAVLMSVLALGVSMTGCSNDDELDAPVVKGSKLIVEASLENTDNGTKAPISVWENGNAMGLFVKSSGLAGDDYGEVVGQVKATYNSNAWTLAPEVSLTGTPANVFAYYPHSTTVTDGTKVPVEVASQTDYLYSGTAVSASSSNSRISLSMKHALCVFIFNVKKNGYIGDAQLTSVKIQNKGGYLLIASKGTMDISTGSITTSAYDPYTISVNKTIVDDGWTSERPLAMLMPFQTASASGAEFVFTVDGKEYTVDVPANMNYAAGQQYVFNLTINSSTMSLDASNIIIVPWGNQQDQDLGGIMTKVGGLAYTLTTKNANEVHSVANIGNVNGTISWDDNSADEAYAVSKTHSFATAGTYNVQVDTEDDVANVEFSKIEAIDEIDLSQLG